MSRFNYTAGTMAQTALNEVNTNHLNDFGYLISSSILYSFLTTKS